MPNWVENKVTFIEGCDELINKLNKLNEESEKIDGGIGLFNSFVPRPAIYEKYDTTNYNGENIKVGVEYYLYYGEDLNSRKVVVTPEILADLKATIKEQREKYGAVGWYDWDCLYWGTKWDVSNWCLGSDTMDFKTAWSHPMEFFIAVSKQYPEAVFAVEYADEDLGSNCGCIFYKNGKYDELDPCFMYAAKVNDMDVSDIYYNYGDGGYWEKSE